MRMEGFLQDPRPAQRIVLLAAFGGYGKTEFARYVAERLAAARVFVDVAWLSLKVEEFGFTLGAISPVPLPFEASRPALVRRLLHRLSCRTEGELRGRLDAEPLLIVVDNLDTLPAGDREAVVSDLHRLLGAGPSRALITSRFDLVPPYVHRPRFGGLSLPASQSLLQDEAHHLPRPSALRAAPPEIVRQVWELTQGMPLALHMVVGQSQQYEVRQILANLEEARTRGSDDDFYRFLCLQAWRELSRPARALLVFLGAATRAPQTSDQLLGIAPSDDVRFDGRTLQRALGELLRWFLVERAEPPELDEPAYDVHPLTRAFVLSEELRARWETELDEARLQAAATAGHRKILERALGPREG